MPTFVNPLALFGLALASAPIIIHLLNRRRFRVREWAAMEYLLASSRKNYRRVRIEQLILLALRVLLIVVLVLLVSRPVVRQRTLGALAERRRFVLLVFDSSMSMGYRDGSTPCYDRGLTFAQELMGSLREGDTWALVAAAGQGRAMVQEPSLDLEAARAAVARDRLALSDEGGSMPRALELAEEVLARSRVHLKEVYVVTDAQRVSWVGPDGVVSPEDIERAKRISKAARVVLVDVGAERPVNLGVTGLETDARVVVAGGETIVRAAVANSSPDDAPAASVHFLVDGFRQQDSPPRPVSAGATEQWEFRHVFRNPGVHTVVVELPNDNLAKDDRRYLAVEVRENIRVLLVDGEPGGDAFTGETDYLRQALWPGDAEEDAARVSLFKPEVVVPDALTAAELPRYDAVVLANVERLPEPVVATLESYVREGGALVVFPGDRVDRDFYNRILYRDGSGLLPCTLGEPVGDPDDRAQATRIADELGEHPFLTLFRDQKVIRLSSALFLRRTPLEGVEGSTDCRVVCRFDTGGPAIVEARRDKGRVVVFASTADDAWNDMASWPAYLTLMQEVLSQVARDPGASRNLRVGEPLVRHLSPRQFGHTVQLVRPGESQPATLQPTAADGLLTVAWPRTERAGIHELLLEPVATRPEGAESPRELFAVNVPARESDVRRASVDELRRLLPGFQFDYQRGAARSTVPVPGGDGGELWRALAYALVGLVLLESVLAQWFGR